MHQDVYDSSNIGTLGRLPPEVRRQIYELYFHRRHMKLYFHLGHVRPQRVHKAYCTDLLLVSKAIHAEAKLSESCALIELSLPSGERASHSFPSGMEMRLSGLEMRILDLTVSLWLRAVAKVSLRYLGLRHCPQLQEIHLWPDLPGDTSIFRQHEGTVDDLVKGRRDHALVQHVQQQPNDKQSSLKTILASEHCRAPRPVRFVVHVTVQVRPYNRSDSRFNLVSSPYLDIDPFLSLAVLI